MLILQPLQLHSTQFTPALEDAFPRKLMANYQLLGAQFQPQDLLFLVTAPPELPEDLGGVTNLTIGSSFQNTQQVLLEVVNNVVNRILLSERAELTYQDSVYISTVLQKLGITDVREFMQQVKNLREETVNVRQLLQMYENHMEQLTAPVRAEERRRRRREAVAASLPPERHGAEPPRAAEEPTARTPGESTTPVPERQREKGRYYLQNEIYRRLDTARIYDTLRQLSVDRTQMRSFLSNRELRFSEQTRVGDNLRLTEMKSRTIFRDSVALQHHVNHYELGDILPPPRTEKEALAAGAAAVLLSTVDNVMVNRVENYLSRPGFWLDLRQALTQTAENSLSRFEEYHSTVDARQSSRETSYARQINQLYQEETKILRNLFEHTTREGDRISVTAPAGDTQIRNLRLEHRQEGERSEETVVVREQSGEGTAPPARELLREATRSVLERTSQSAAPRPAIQIPGPELLQRETERLSLEHRQTEVSETRTESETRHRTETYGTERHTERVETPGERRELLRDTLLSRETREAVTRETERPPEMTELRMSAPPPGAELLQRETERLSLEHRRTDTSETRTESETWHRTETHGTERHTERVETPGERRELLRDTLLSRETREAVTRELGVLSEPQGSVPEPQIPLVLESRTPSVESEQGHKEEQTVMPADPAASMELLRTRLDEINRKNRETYERIQILQSEQLRGRAPRPDRKRLREDALRAIGEPEQVLMEALTAPEPPSMEHRHPPAVEAILSQMDETTRHVYETALLYQENPQAAMDRGLFRPGNAGAFNADVARVSRPEPEQLQHPVPPETPETEDMPAVPARESGELLERFLERPGARQEEFSWSRLPRTRTVFRQAEPDITEELLERLEQQRTQSVRTVEQKQETTNRSVSQTEINNIRQELVSRTTEDITEVINRAMARQLGSITDRVYNQIERRLESERARRGRF